LSGENKKIMEYGIRITEHTLLSMKNLNLPLLTSSPFARVPTS